jgi:hypothetical protein
MNINTKVFRALSELAEVDRPDIRIFVLMKEDNVYVEVTQFENDNEPAGTVQISLSLQDVEAMSISLLVRYFRQQIKTIL